MNKVLCPVNVADRTQNRFSVPVPVLSERSHNCKHSTLHIIKNHKDAQNGYFILHFYFSPKFILFYAYELPTYMFICTTCARKYPWRPEKDVDP